MNRISYFCVAVVWLFTMPQFVFAAIDDYQYFDTSFEQSDETWPDGGSNTSWRTQEESLTGDWSYKVTNKLFTSLLPGDDKNLTKITFNHKGHGTWNVNRHSFPSTEEWTSRTQFLRNDPDFINGRYEWHNDGKGITYIDDVSIVDAEPYEYYDHIRSVIDPYGSSIEISPSSLTTQNIPKTLHAIRSGKNVNVVMLGDSIIADTTASYWDALVESDNALADLDLTLSVRSGTGMDWYSGYGDFNLGRERIQEYVIDHDPDLVFIGGISHSWQSEYYEYVVDIIREFSDVEIIITTGSAGPEDSHKGDARLHDDFYFEIEDGPEGFRSELKDIAIDKGISFIDMRGSWGQFTLGLDPDVPYSDFLRDTLHMDGNGTYVAGMIIQEWFRTAPSQGDFNLDGNIDALDIDGFISTVTSSSVSDLDLYLADFNLDGDINGLDIDLFVNTLISNQNIPEPSSIVLTCFGIFILKRKM